MSREDKCKLYSLPWFMKNLEETIEIDRIFFSTFQVSASGAWCLGLGAGGDMCESNSLLGMGGLLASGQLRGGRVQVASLEESKEGRISRSTLKFLRTV